MDAETQKSANVVVLVSVTDSRLSVQLGCQTFTYYNSSRDPLCHSVRVSETVAKLNNIHWGSSVLVEASNQQPSAAGANTFTGALQ